MKSNSSKPSQAKQNTQIESLEPLVLMSASAADIDPLIVAADNVIDGTAEGEWLSGTAANDLIRAGGGDDEIYDPLGDNFIDGGDGLDTLVVYQGDQADFNIYRSSDGRTFVEGPGINGQNVRQEMVNVERILFNDGPMNVEDAPIILIVDPPPVEPPVEPSPTDPLIVNPDNEVNGTDAGEWLSGTAGNDLIRAGGGNDEIHAPIGENFIDGGDGVDTLIVYEGNKADFNVYQSSDGRVFVDGTGVNGQRVRQEMVNAERILFNDGFMNVEDAPVVLIIEPPVEPFLGDNLLENGSFEDNSVALNRWGLGLALNGWSGTRPAFFEIQRLVNHFGNADDGTSWVELDTVRNGNIVQSVDSAAGQTYQVSYAYSPRPNTASDTTGVEVYWNGQLIDTILEMEVPRSPAF